MAGSQGQVGVLVGGGRHCLDLLHQDDMIALRRDQKTLDILQRALFLQLLDALHLFVFLILTQVELAITQIGQGSALAQPYRVGTYKLVQHLLVLAVHDTDPCRGAVLRYAIVAHGIGYPAALAIHLGTTNTSHGPQAFCSQSSALQLDLRFRNRRFAFFAGQFLYSLVRTARAKHTNNGHNK